MHISTNIGSISVLLVKQLDSPLAIFIYNTKKRKEKKTTLAVFHASNYNIKNLLRIRALLLFNASSLLMTETDEYTLVVLELC